MKTMRISSVVLAMMVVASACNFGGATGGLAGEVNVDGSSTVFPITQAVAELFNEEQPGVRISVGVSGTGGGFKKFCSEVEAERTHVSDASRPIKDSEIELCEQQDVEWEEFTVAIDGLSVLIHPDNDFVDCLTVEELSEIWATGSQITNWSQVRDGFPDREIVLYGPGTDSGTFDYFTEAVNGEEGVSRDDYTASEDDNVLVQGIAGDATALGYFGYAYYSENADKLKALAIDGGDGCVEPTEQTINNGTYAPLSRPLFIYVSKSATTEEQVVAFIDFYFANVNFLVGDVGYIPQPDDVLNEQIANWEAFKA